MSIPAATDGAVFCAPGWSSCSCLSRAPHQTLRRSSIMDNLAAHMTPGRACLLDGSGFAYRYLRRYSPDPNPIEPAWAKVKGLLRKAAARTVDGLHAALGPALAAITKDDARGFFAMPVMPVPTACGVLSHAGR